MEGGDHRQGDHQPFRGHTGQEGLGQNPLIPGTGFFPHHGIRMGFQPQGNGGQGVCQEIDKQQVYRSKGYRQRRQGGIQHGQDGGGVAGEQELNGLFDVGVHISAVLDRLNDGCKVIVCQYHAGGVLGHLRTSDAHGDADIRLLEGRGVIDPVAGHSHQASPVLPGPDNADFVFRGDPGVYRDLGHKFPQLFVAHGLDHAALYRLGAGGEDADFPRDGGGCHLVVAGDHDGADAGGNTLRHSGLGFLPGRVHHSNQTQEI